jgi:hypothetical protein
LAKYTTQVRTIVESGVDLFDFDYPIFDEAYREVLENNIINHYYFREIGLETVGQFKWFLKAKLNLIMPLYNEHYLANELFKTYDPYKNKNVTTTDTRTQTTDSTSTTDSTGTSTADGTNTGTGKSVFADTPQARLQGEDYATNMTETDDSTTTSSTGTSDETVTGTGKVTTVDEYTQTIAGHDGMKYPSGILQEIRETFINIDKMIIDELNDLFMNIY